MLTQVYWAIVAELPLGEVMLDKTQAQSQLWHLQTIKIRRIHL